MLSIIECFPASDTVRQKSMSSSFNINKQQGCNDSHCVTFSPGGKKKKDEQQKFSQKE